MSGFVAALSARFAVGYLPLVGNFHTFRVLRKGLRRIDPFVGSPVGRVARAIVPRVATRTRRVVT
ncbi:hypothetical protein NCC78_11520 [Micromonospora phytophila]|uniref:hypothetical protein n=1 Tax=Micromonospora phytophila TaxID=709888 RepID=UPI0020303755|nr:hypothetical protein [Micromonospora phytophila]MCM0675311.1 hypothetical protein [Micromonospora phytophila]